METKKPKWSTFLFSLPSLEESLGRAFDLAGATSQLNFLEGHMDRLALMADWAAVGEDLEAVLGDFWNELTEKERLKALLALLSDEEEG